MWGNILKSDILLFLRIVNASYMITKIHNEIIAKINMLQNKIFSFIFSYEANRALKVGCDDNSWLWHI